MAESTLFQGRSSTLPNEDELSDVCMYAFCDLFFSWKRVKDKSSQRMMKLMF